MQKFQPAYPKNNFLLLRIRINKNLQPGFVKLEVCSVRNSNKNEMNRCNHVQCFSKQKNFFEAT